MLRYLPVPPVLRDIYGEGTDWSKVCLPGNLDSTRDEVDRLEV